MGVGVPLVGVVDLIDTHHRLSLWPLGLWLCLATTRSFLPNFSSLQCLGVSHVTPGVLVLFLVVGQQLVLPKGHIRPSHSTPLSFSNNAVVPLLAPAWANHGV